MAGGVRLMVFDFGFGPVRVDPINGWVERTFTYTPHVGMPVSLVSASGEERIVTDVGVFVSGVSPFGTVRRLLNEFALCIEVSKKIVVEGPLVSWPIDGGPLELAFPFHVGGGEELRVTVLSPTGLLSPPELRMLVHLYGFHRPVVR